MTKAEEWLYTEAAFHRRTIAVIHCPHGVIRGGRIAIVRVNTASLPKAGLGAADYRVLGVGRSFTMAYNDARKRGNIRRKV